MTPARAVRMVSSIVDVVEADVKEIQAVIGRHPGETLKQMSEEDRQLGRIYNRSEPARELLKRAALIEGLPSGFIKSRRSVAFSSVALTNYFAESIDGETGDLFVHVGRELLPVDPFLRIDFTTLVAVEVIDRVDRELEKGGVSYKWENFPRSDRRVWEEIQDGDTTGIFLFDGEVIQQQRQTFPLETMYDLTNLLALLRFRGDERTLAKRIEDFKRGEIISGSDPPEVLRILTPTRGNIVYDEQLRDVIQALTAVDAVDALGLMHDAGTGNPGALAQVRSRFMRAMAERDAPMELANAWFDRILFYARKTIHRERVLADAILVYDMFYLKVHHPGVFYAALLNSHADHETRRTKYLEQLDDMGVVLPLDVSHSAHEFQAIDGQVRVGFCVVAEVDPMVVNRIIKARGKSGFRSMDDFVKKTRRDVDADTTRRLVEAGAFDSVGDRDRLLEALDGRAESPSPARARKKPVNKHQMNLPFGDEADSV